ncbi:hypothetical protein BDA96_05G180300, partial [Sorghum bicolor]
SARAAARTSVLSRRWRHVWADVPELILDGGGPDAPPSFLDVVDAALGAHAAPTVERLLIAVGDADADAITSDRAASWLRFAATRVAGTLSLLVPQGLGWWSSSLIPVELPVCGRAKRVTLQLRDAWRLQPPPPAAGVFMALTALTILFGRMEGSELTALVSTQCPCLRDLKLSLSLVHVSGVVSVHSDTLRSLQLCICNSTQVEVIAPRLEKLCVYDTFMGRISAPKLSELFWTGGNADGSHQFDVVSRRLRLLEIVGLRSITKSLLQQFDEVEEMKLFMSIPKGTEGYRIFLNQTNKLPMCKTLHVSILDFNHHGLAPTLLHLLKICNSTTKEVYFQLIPHDYQQEYSCPSSCPCRLPESQMVDVMTLTSLEEVIICSHSKSYGELEFVQKLCKCNATSLKKLVTVHDNERSRVHVESNEVTEKIRTLYPPNVKVEFYVI